MPNTEDDVIFNELKNLYKNKEFLLLETNEQKIEFILHRMCPLGTFRRVIYGMADQSLLERQKSTEQTLHYRAEGQQLFYTHYKEAFIAFSHVCPFRPNYE
jgi:hypothetical protein